MEEVDGFAWMPAVTMGFLRLEMKACSSTVVVTSKGKSITCHSFSTASSEIFAKEAYHPSSRNIVAVSTSWTGREGSKHGLHRELCHGHSSSSALALTLELTLE
jgi:hypothetical protein